MKKIPVILDCDPGHDDAIAMILALASDKLDVRLITTVGGNQTVEKTTNNALKVLSFIGKDVRVCKGADMPMSRELEIAEEVHGDSGLDGPELPEATLKACEENAYKMMAKVIEDSEDKVTLVPTGPLTNIAIFLSAYPHLHDKIERISLMGGCAIGGNWTAAAEFNILVDPEAASIVFKSGIPITMAGLDVTHRAQIREDDIKKIKSQGGKVAIMIGELLEFFMKFHEEVIGWDFAPLHDPCAVAYLLEPDMFKREMRSVKIDLAGQYTTGCTVTDFRPFSEEEKNVEVLLDVDKDRFVDLIIDCVNKYD